MSEENDEIKISEIVELIESSIEDLEKDIREKELSTKELEKILDAEKADKNRSKAKKLIRRQIKKQKIIDQLDVAEADVEEIKSSLEYIRDEKNLERIGDTEELDRHELLEIVGGTVQDLRDYLKDHNPSEKQLKELLEAEKIVKDRKTAKQALETELDKRKLEEDVEHAEEDIEKLEKDIEELEKDSNDQEVDEDDLEIEDPEHSPKDEDMEQLEEEMDRLESEEQRDEVDESEEDEDEEELQKAMDEAEDELEEKDDLDEFIEDLEEEEDSDIFEEDEEPEELELSSAENDTEGSGEQDDSDDEEHPEDSSDSASNRDQVTIDAQINQGSDPETSETDEGSKVSDGSSETDRTSVEENEESSEDSDKPENEEEEKDQEEIEEDDKESEDDGNFEEKQEILDDLDIDLSEEEIKEISLEDLKEIKQEKMDRERLISKLSEEGLNEETLRNSSTKDLRKLAEDLLDDEEEEKDQEEIEEEAQEDLEMLMGAGRSDGQSTENSDDRFRNFKDTKQKIMKLIHGEKETTPDEDKEKTRTQKMEKESIIEVLDKYRDLDDSNEAAIKTAHVMKGFLEYRYNIDKEKTYKELAEELEEKREEENFQKFLGFLKKLHEDEYIGNINIENIDEVIDNAETVVEDIG